MSRYLVVGSGLIGTSIALGLRANGDDVLLADADPAALETAMDKSGGRAWDGAESVDVVIVATPPAATSDVIRDMAQRQDHAVIVDVCSVKCSVFDRLSDLPRQAQERLVGSHPMAGREVSGARGAQSNLFVDRPWVITRGAHSSDEAVAAVRDVVVRLGAVPVERTMADHDRAVALVSHTPQVVASVLAAQLGDAAPADVELAGQGLRDTIRIAGSEPALWTQILLGNAGAVADQVNRVASGLSAAADAIRRGDERAVTEIITAGGTGRDQLPGKHGTARTDVVTSVVRVEDKPGELARLFAVAAAAQVNLEDVRIDHSLGRMTGLVELTVAPGSATALTAALDSAGFKVVG